MPAAPQPTAEQPGVDDARRARLLDLLAAGAIVALGLVAYSNALGGAFVFDDVKEIRDNPLVRDLWNFLPGRYTGTPTRWLTYLTFALNYRLGGTATGGFHAVNVLVHLANALLVYALVRLTFRTPRLSGSGLAPAARTIAFVAATLFVTHPLMSQAVAYIVQRLASLAATLYLGTVVLYARWRLGDREGRPRAELLAGGAAVLVAALLAQTAKETAFTLPFAVVLYELAFFEGPARLRALRLAPALAALPVVPVGTLAALWVHHGGAAALAVGTRLTSAIPRLDYARTQLVVVVRYLGLALWPSGQTIDHDVAIRHSLVEPAVLGALALLLGLAGLAAFLLRRGGAPGGLDPAARLAAFGILWFFLALAVESSIIPIADVMFEHRAYLPAAGLAVAFAVGLAALARRLTGTASERVTLLVGGVLAAVLAVATVARNAVWADDLSLWSDAALKTPLKARPFMNLGTALALAGERELGVRALRQAVRLDPASSYGHAQLAAALLALGRTGEGEAELREVLRVEPRDPEALFNLAQLLWRTGRQGEARPLFRRFADVAPPAYAQARQIAAARAAATSP